MIDLYIGIVASVFGTLMIIYLVLAISNILLRRKQIRMENEIMQLDKTREDYENMLKRLVEARAKSDIEETGELGMKKVTDV